MGSKKQWVHKKIKAIYSFNPKAGSEKYQYRCPFCQMMVNSKRFMDLQLPTLDSNVILYGGYRGIRHYKSVLNPEMRLRVLEAIKEKIKWLYEKIGGEIEWLRSKSVSIRAVPNTSYLMMGKPLTLPRISVSKRSGLGKIVKTTKLLFGKQTKQLW